LETDQTVKIYIAADMEGISGIWGSWQLQEDQPHWIEARRLLTGDINAAVEGALDNGATEVVVWDNHYRGRNVLIEGVHEEAQIIMGWPHNPRFPGLDESFAGVYLVGYHAMVGTEDAVLDHTLTPEMRSVTLNGNPVGEVALDALWAGSIGVPVLLVTGDDKACEEARRFLGEIETAVVKEGIHRHMAKMLPAKRARALIREKAGLALERIGGVKPFKLAPPYEKRVVYASADLVEGRTFDGQRIERVDAVTVAYRSDDLVDILTMW
jgi:D-amino peptidase